jgi:hypothetical protein
MSCASLRKDFYLGTQVAPFTLFLPTSKNLVNVLANLKTTLCHDFIQNQTNIPLLVNILSNSSKDENQHANIHMVIDDDETN